MMKGEKKAVSIILPLELYQNLRVRALAGNRTLPGYIRLILTRYLAYLEQHGEKDDWLLID